MSTVVTDSRALLLPVCMCSPWTVVAEHGKPRLPVWFECTLGAASGSQPCCPPEPAEAMHAEGVHACVAECLAQARSVEGT